MEEDLKKLLEENLEISRKNYQATKYIKRYVIWSQVMDVIKILIIVIPIILGIIYLPSLLKNLFGQYQDLLGVGNNNFNVDELLKGKTQGIDLNKIDINNLPDQLKELLKN